MTQSNTTARALDDKAIRRNGQTSAAPLRRDPEHKGAKPEVVALGVLYKPTYYSSFLLLEVMASNLTGMAFKLLAIQPLDGIQVFNFLYHLRSKRTRCKRKFTKSRAMSFGPTGSARAATGHKWTDSTREETHAPCY